MNKNKIGRDGKPLIYCLNCGRGYGQYQKNMIVANIVCVACGKPIKFKEVQ